MSTTDRDRLLVDAFDLAEALVDAVSASRQDWLRVQRQAYRLGAAAGRMAVLDAAADRGEP